MSLNVSLNSYPDVLESISEHLSPLRSFNVPGWSLVDVCAWVRRIAFTKYVGRFTVKRVDGDLLLQMTDDQLKEEIGFVSEIERKRFMRELEKLKRTADYSSVDPTGLKSVLQSIGPELTVYTYPMLKAGVDSVSIRYVSEHQLADECGITNSIHRTRILNCMIYITIDPPDCIDSRTQTPTPDVGKDLDAFISYERSTSAKLASLLRDHLKFRGYSVCLEPSDRIKQAKNFLLVLMPQSLDGCIGDEECNNCMHKEIVDAMKHECNIIPVMDNFQWPDVDALPDDMRDVPRFNGVRWVHDYRDACVDKVEKFMRGSVKISYPVVPRSAPNTPLMQRSRIAFNRALSNCNSEHHGSCCNLLTVSADRFNDTPKSSISELCVPRQNYGMVTKSLDDLLENMSEQEETEQIVEHGGVGFEMYIPTATPKMNTLDRSIEKIKSAFRHKKKTSKSSK